MLLPTYMFLWSSIVILFYWCVLTVVVSMINTSKKYQIIFTHTVWSLNAKNENLRAEPNSIPGAMFNVAVKVCNDSLVSSQLIPKINS